MKDTFLIVDGNSLIHRAFHALPLMDADGVYTNAIHGFLTMVMKAAEERNARYLAVCFDEHAPTFRHQVFPEYKAGRAPTAPELVQQLGTIRTVLTDLGVKWYAVPGWEADDLLGTLSRLGVKAGLAPLLLTGDRDALQLVDDDVRLLFTRKGISETVLFTPASVYENYGFPPERVTDWKGLAGDSSDNISGIPGVGDKTAVKLLQEYGSLEEVLAHAGSIKGKLGEKLAANADLARRCQDLATIRRNAPIVWTAEMTLTPDWRKGIPALKKLKLNQLVRRIGDPGEADSAASAEEPAAAPETAVSFGEPEPLTEPEALTQWLQAVRAEARPVAVAVSESAVSLADGDGRCCVLTLGGDLLNPGADPHAVLAVLSEELTAHPGAVHDGKALLHLLQREGLPLPKSFAWDSMLGAYLIDPQQKSYTLAALADPADARGVRKLTASQQPQITAMGMEQLMREIELPLQHVLFSMETDGFTVDTEFLRTLGKAYTAEIEQRQQEVYAACGGKAFNLNSTTQLGDVLFNQLQLPHGKKTARGYSTAADVLEGLRDIAPEIIEPLLRYRQLMKLNSTYVEGLLRLTDAGGRVHSTFDQVATATGRISSSEPNLQNIPVRTQEGKEIRRAFLPRAGWVLVDADYSQIELRLMAHFSGDEAMVEAFRTGQDVHARTASEIFEVPLDQVTPELRSQAKAVNFGLIYGISGFGLSRNTGVSQAEAKDFIRRYFAKYPGVKRFMDEAVTQGAEKGYAETLFARRRYLPELKSPKAQIREFGKRAAMNTPVQGTAADIIKLAMVRVADALKQEGLRSRLILQVHDELLLECPPEEVTQAKALLQHCMESVIALEVPLSAEVHSGENWAEAK